MAYEAVVKRYLRELEGEYNSAVRGGQHTGELSYRAPMHEFFKALARELNPAGSFDIILEPKRQLRVGRPDWRVHDSVSLGIYGYIEAKPLTVDPLDLSPHRSQIDKYLSLGHKLVITDGIDFVFAFPGRETVTVSLVDKSLMSRRNWQALAPNPQFRLYMEQFFSRPAPQQVDEEKLVGLVAIRTRNLADEILTYAGLSYDEAIDAEEREIIRLLSGMKELIYSHGDAGMHSSRAFSEFTAQVIMFCLLYAHRVLCASEDSPTQKAEKIRSYAFSDTVYGEALPPFRDLMVYIRDHADGDMFICRWIDECVLFLSFVQMTSRELLNPDYHRLFELFLAKYDPKSRFDYGAFYTPRKLADFVVRLVNAVSRDSFAGASIYDDGSVIIDPCCGTGSFLEAVISQDGSDGAYSLTGIEILPAPYMLANYRMALLRRTLGERSFSCEIILADTLRDGEAGPFAADSIEGRELLRAGRAAEAPIRLIIGNPPCSDSKRNLEPDGFSAINDLMDDFRPPPELRGRRQNIQKQVSNPFMMFLRWSCAKLLASLSNSALAMVVPLSFLEAESFKYARKYLSEHSSKLWAVALDADARTGARSDSLFNTMQGRAVIILLRKSGEEGGISELYYADYTGKSRDEKLRALDESAQTALDGFERLALDKGTYAFCPAGQFDERLYGSFWPVSGSDGPAIFLNQCSGAKLSPTSLLTHVNPSMLKRRSREIAAEGEPAAARWTGRQDKTADPARVRAFQEAMSTLTSRRDMDAVLRDNTIPVSFRPFVNSYALVWGPLVRRLAATGGGGTRIRPELRTLYAGGDAIGFSLAHAPKDLSESLGRFASFCWYFPDNDLTRRRNGHVYANRYVDKDRPRTVNNVSPALLDAISSMTGLAHESVARACVFYCYAILCSQVYLDEFYGALFTVNRSDMRCRIPIVADCESFIAIAATGEKLARLEADGADPENVLGLDYEGILSLLPEGFHLMHSRSAAKSPFDAETEELVLRSEDSPIELRVPCPVAIQRFTISGYNVLKDCYLKFHSYRYTNCEFTRQDLSALLDLLNAIATQQRLTLEVDEFVRRIVAGDIPLIKP